jgi:hypothetical protein
MHLYIKKKKNTRWYEELNSISKIKW